MAKEGTQEVTGFITSTCGTVYCTILATWVLTYKISSMQQTFRLDVTEKEVITYMRKMSFLNKEEVEENHR